MLRFIRDVIKEATNSRATLLEKENLSLTKRQTIATERNLIIGAALALILILVTFLQWWTSSSLKNLEFARSSARIFIDETRHISENAGLPAPLPTNFEFRGSPGVSRIDAATVEEVALIHAHNGNSPAACAIHIKNFYRNTGESAKFKLSPEGELLNSILMSNSNPTIGGTIQHVGIEYNVYFSDIFERDRASSGIKMTTGTISRSEKSDELSQTPTIILVKSSDQRRIIFALVRAGKFDPSCNDTFKILNSIQNISWANAYVMNERRELIDATRSTNLHPAYYALKDPDVEDSPESHPLANIIIAPGV